MSTKLHKGPFHMLHIMFLAPYSNNEHYVFFLSFKTFWANSVDGNLMIFFLFEPAHDKTNKDSDQPEYLPILIIVFDVRSTGSQGPQLSSCRQLGL